MLFSMRKVNHEKRFVVSGDGRYCVSTYERLGGGCARWIWGWRPSDLGGWYGPYWGPYWGPAYFGAYNAYPNIGEVKLETKVRDAQVFINGAYSGTTHENKTMRLRPGTYNIEIREGNQTPFSQKIFVVAGKTMHLHPTL